MQMTSKQESKLAKLQAAVAARGENNRIEVIPELPECRQPKAYFPLDSTALYVLVNGRGHVAISTNGAVDLPFVRSFRGSYFDGAVIADQLEAECDPDGFKIRRCTSSGSSPVRIPEPLVPHGAMGVPAGRLNRYFERSGQERALLRQIRICEGLGHSVQNETV
jgi:hypothetical protein